MKHIASKVQMRHECKILIEKSNRTGNLNVGVTQICLKETDCKILDRIYQPQERGQWLSLVKTIMKLRFHEQR